MKIAHITPVYPPYAGGIGTVAREYVTRLVKRGYQAVVFTPRYPGLPSERFEDGIEVRALKGVFSYGKGALLPQLILSLRKFDVIHLHYPFYGAEIFAALAAIIWRKPLIITYHMKTKGSGLLRLIFSTHRRTIEPLVLKCAKKVLVSSFDYAQSVGLKHRNLTEMPFGVDAERFSPGVSFARQQLGLDPKSTVFIFVGGLDDAHYFKGVDSLLCAAARIHKDRLWDLLIVGSGNCLEDYRKLSRDFGIESKVHFAGKVAPAQLPDYYRSADVHVLPSIDRSEAFGLVTLEAAACGLPSIVSDLPGVRLLVINHETGLHVPPGDVSALTSALTQMIDQKENRQRFGARARERVEQIYSQTRRLDDLCQIYESSKRK